MGSPLLYSPRRCTLAAERRFAGTPRTLDDALRPAVRVVQLGLGGLASVVLWWWGALWLAPTPLIASFIAYEFFFWRRADRPLSVRLGPEVLTIHDRGRGQTLTVSRESIVATDVWVRDTAHGSREAVVRLSDVSGPLVAVRMLGAPPAAALGPAVVDADAADAALGGLAGVQRAVTPFDTLVRQPIPVAALQPLLEWADPATRDRTVVRLWRGDAPPLDLFGLHQGPHDAVLALDGPRWELWDVDGTSLQAGTLLQGLTVATRARATVLLHFEGDEAVSDEAELAMWLFELGTTRIAVPAPLASDHEPRRAAEATDLHTSLPEGAALLWHLARVLPSTRWPGALRRALPPTSPLLDLARHSP